MAEEDEWEESLVMMDLNGIIDSDWISKCGNTWKIIGIESETPILQIGHYVFTGKYEDTVGTSVLFRVDKNDPEKDRHMLNKRNSLEDEPFRLSYSAHLFKRLQMQRSFLTERERPGLHPDGLVPTEDSEGLFMSKPAVNNLEPAAGSSAGAVSDSPMEVDPSPSKTGVSQKQSQTQKTSKTVGQNTKTSDMT